MTSRLSQYEEVFDQAYTHGLEAIYKLQTVDLSSIRRVGGTPVNETKTFVHALDDQQLTLDFGPVYRDWVKPFWFDEPIRVLGLSVNAQRGLVALRKERLEDLAELDFRQLVFGKTLGQGHLDEIQQKLANYLAGVDRERTRRLDIASWVRGLCGELESKSAYLLCERFGLQQCLTLSVGELGELKRASKDLRVRWLEEAFRQINKSSLIGCWQAVVQAFLLPWMRQRNGLASFSQLTERLQQLSLQPNLVAGLLHMLAELLQRTCPYSIVLHSAEENVFCDSLASLKQYDIVLDLCQSYFRQSCPQYSYEHLICLVAQDLAKQWEEIDEALIERCLRLTNSFLVRKLPKVGLIVEKNIL